MRPPRICWFIISLSCLNLTTLPPYHKSPAPSSVPGNSGPIAMTRNSVHPPLKSTWLRPELPHRTHVNQFQADELTAGTVSAATRSVVNDTFPRSKASPSTRMAATSRSEGLDPEPTGFNSQQAHRNTRTDSPKQTFIGWTGNLSPTIKCIPCLQCGQQQQLQTTSIDNNCYKLSG